jgi:hypothetical protein
MRKFVSICLSVVAVFCLLVFFPLIVRGENLPLTTTIGYNYLKRSLNDLSASLEPYTFLYIVRSFESSLSSLVSSFTSDQSFFEKVFEGITGIFSLVALPFKIFYNYLAYGFSFIFAFIRFILSLLWGFFN